MITLAEAVRLSPRSRRVSSNPSIVGIITSARTRSGQRSRERSSARAPSLATRTSYPAAFSSISSKRAMNVGVHEGRNRQDPPVGVAPAARAAAPGSWQDGNRIRGYGGRMEVLDSFLDAVGDTPLV